MIKDFLSLNESEFIEWLNEYSMVGMSIARKKELINAMTDKQKALLQQRNRVLWDKTVDEMIEIMAKKQ